MGNEGRWGGREAGGKGGGGKKRGRVGWGGVLGIKGGRNRRWEKPKKGKRSE